MEVDSFTDTAIKPPGHGGSLATEGVLLHPHAYHLAFPSVHKHPVSNVPYITLHAERKARGIVKLVEGMILKEEMYLENSNVGEEDEKLSEGGMRVDIGDDEDDDVDVGEDEEGKGEEEAGADGLDMSCTMVSRSYFLFLNENANSRGTLLGSPEIDFNSDLKYGVAILDNFTS